MRNHGVDLRVLQAWSLFRAEAGPSSKRFQFQAGGWTAGGGFIISSDHYLVQDRREEPREHHPVRPSFGLIGVSVVKLGALVPRTDSEEHQTPEEPKVKMSF